MDEQHEILAQEIRRLAKAQRIPLSHVADRAGVARSHFWEVVGGRRSPTLAWMLKIAEVLQTSPSGLLVRTPSEGEQDGSG